MYVLGVPITIRVDDYIPTYYSYTSTYFSKMWNQGVWMPVLEKGFAKLGGNYSGLVSGTSDKAIMSLLGLPGATVTVT